MRAISVGFESALIVADRPPDRPNDVPGISLIASSDSLRILQQLPVHRLYSAHLDLWVRRN